MLNSSGCGANEDSRYFEEDVDGQRHGHDDDCGCDFDCCIDVLDGIGFGNEGYALDCYGCGDVGDVDDVDYGLGYFDAACLFG